MSSVQIGCTASTRPSDHSAALVLIGVAHAAEELAHDGDGNVLGKVGDEVATAVRGHAVEQPVDEGLRVRTAGVDRARREVRIEHLTDARVVGRIHERQHPAEHPERLAVLEARVLLEARGVQALSDVGGAEDVLARREVRREPEPELAVVHRRDLAQARRHRVRIRRVRRRHQRADE